MICSMWFTGLIYTVIMTIEDFILSAVDPVLTLLKERKLLPVQTAPGRAAGLLPGGGQASRPSFYFALLNHQCPGASRAGKLFFALVMSNQSLLQVIGLPFIKGIEFGREKNIHVIHLHKRNPAISGKKWAQLGSNQRPPDYESGALTS